MSQRVSRPVARYRPGQAPVHTEKDSSSSSSSDEEAAPRVQQRVSLPSRVTSAPRPPPSSAATWIHPPPQVPQGHQLELSEYETDTDDESDDREGESRNHGPNPSLKLASFSEAQKPPRTPTTSASSRLAPPRPLNKQALPPSSVTLGEVSAAGAHEDSIKAESGSDSESESGTESESLSESDEVPAPLPKPIFVSKYVGDVFLLTHRRDRVTHGSGPTEHVESTRRGVEEKRIHRERAHELAAQRIVRDMQEREHEDSQCEVDDTDGMDPEAEFTAWRIRELARLERIRQAERMRESQEAEKARRRAMPEHERLAEDLAHARHTRAAKQRGHQGFMQKYYHKGAFFQDMDILQRDYTHSTVDAVDKSQLPQIMQKRNFGKRSQSKWTHLAGEDTTRQKEGEPDLRMQGAYLAQRHVR